MMKNNPHSQALADVRHRITSLKQQQVELDSSVGELKQTVQRLWHRLQTPSQGVQVQQNEQVPPPDNVNHCQEGEQQDNNSNGCHEGDEHSCDDDFGDDDDCCEHESEATREHQNLAPTTARRTTQTPSPPSPPSPLPTATNVSVVPMHISVLTDSSNNNTTTPISAAAAGGAAAETDLASISIVSLGSASVGSCSPPPPQEEEEEQAATLTPAPCNNKNIKNNKKQIKSQRRRGCRAHKAYKCPKKWRRMVRSGRLRSILLPGF